MKISCEVIKDLMLLCEENDCSEDSKTLVEQHKKECRECTEYYNKLYNTEAMVSEVKKEFEEERVLHRGFKKIKRRWAFCLACLFMIVPIIGVSVLGYNEKRGEGVCFSNIDDIYRCVEFMNYIEEENFEKVAGCMDFSEVRYDFAENVRNLSREEFVIYMKEKVVKKLEEYRKRGLSIRDVSYEYAYKTDSGWQVEISFYEIYPDGSNQRVTACLDANTLRAGAYQMASRTKDCYIDEVLGIFIQDDPLHYSEMEVVYSLKEGERAIVRPNFSNADIEAVEHIGLFDVSYGTGIEMNVRDETDVKHLETSVPGEYAISVWNRNGEKMNIEELIKIEIEKYEGNE